MVSDNDHRVILDLLSQIPFQKAMRQRGEPPLTLKDLRAFRTLRDFEIASKKPNKATPALLILRKVQRRLRVYERHIHEMLLNEELSAKGVLRGKSAAEEIAPGRWQTLKLDFLHAAADEGLRTVYRGILLAKTNSAAWRPGANAVKTAKKGRGRPSIRGLYLEEFERMCAEHRVDKLLKVNVNILCDWFKRVHPDKKLPVPDTIENNIRAPWNAYWKKARK